VVLGSDDLVSEVALAGQIDVGELVVLVDAALHSGLESAESAGLHLWRLINII
jgi:hypothetical protein